jgi:hypothetical protein
MTQLGAALQEQLWCPLLGLSFLHSSITTAKAVPSQVCSDPSLSLWASKTHPSGEWQDEVNSLAPAQAASQ